jgi:hypothetical protein
MLIPFAIQFLAMQYMLWLYSGMWQDEPEYIDGTITINFPFLATFVARKNKKNGEIQIKSGDKWCPYTPPINVTFKEAI